MGESLSKEDAIHEKINAVYSLFRRGDFTDALEVLEDALALDFEHKDVLSALKCANFWKERVPRLSEMTDPFEIGEYLFKEWKVFLHFMGNKRDSFEQGIFAIRQWVFGHALLKYTKVLRESGDHDAEILFRVGRCYKGIGDYEHAIEFMEMANRKRREDPEILAELADCYAIINEVRASKVFFREAFFINPQKVDITNLESLAICRLIERLQDMGYASPELQEWIPVYGVIFGVFNVKRELKAIEYGKLKQTIFSYEAMVAEDRERAVREFVIPRLLNRYFWLIDHYIISGEPREKIDEVLSKIRNIDESIYTQYNN